MSQKKTKSPKNPKYFIVVYPNGVQALIKCKSWHGLIPYTKYIKEEFEDDTIFVAIRWHEAVKYIFTGKVFNLPYEKSR